MKAEATEVCQADPARVVGWASTKRKQRYVFKQFIVVFDVYAENACKHTFFAFIMCDVLNAFFAVRVILQNLEKSLDSSVASNASREKTNRFQEQSMWK